MNHSLSCEQVFLGRAAIFKTVPEIGCLSRISDFTEVVILLDHVIQDEMRRVSPRSEAGKGELRNLRYRTEELLKFDDCLPKEAYGEIDDAVDTLEKAMKETGLSKETKAAISALRDVIRTN